MKKLIAIGGGEIGGSGFSVETAQIDEEIVRMSGKKNPRLLFIPTASGDSESYFEDIKNHFGNRLSCKLDVLYLIKERLSKREIEKKILGADIIYVGGGNTLKMMKIWRKVGVDKSLRRAYNKGRIISGISAGAICWFDSGHSDSMKFYDAKKWNYINVKGMGLVRGIFCPHYDGESLGMPRKEHFKNLIKKIGGIGIAVDNNCAIEIIDDKYFKIVASNPGAAAYRVYKKHGRVVAERIEMKQELLPLGNLYEKGYRLL
jgi:dipeptidase E